MVITKDLKNQINTVVSMALEDESFEDYLERFDLTPQEVFLVLYENGHIDTEAFEDFLTDEE